MFRSSLRLLVLLCSASLLATPCAVLGHADEAAAAKNSAAKEPAAKEPAAKEPAAKEPARGGAGVVPAEVAERVSQIEAEMRSLGENEAALAEQVLDARRKAADSDRHWQSLRGELQKLEAAVSKAEQERDQQRQHLEELQKQAAGLADRRRAYQTQIETALRESGDWVSFTDTIAPIFHARCVACHNARNAQGRYNMANFDAIRSMAESGVAIEPGDAEHSLLVQLIEDGSMPYDADPLSQEQIAAVKKWIALGARIEAAADAQAPLVRLMPRGTQPEPPLRYATPIPVSALAVDPRGERVASSGYHEVLLWALESGELSGRIANVAERVYGLDFDPDGKRLAVASGTPGQWGEVKLFDSHSGELLKDVWVSEDAMFAVAFSPDGKRLAASGADGSIVIFSLDGSTGGPRVVEDHSDWVNAVSWSPDGRMLLSASRDKTAKVFDAATGELKITFSGHNQNVSAAGFLGDGKRAFSVGDDRRIRLWNVADAKQVREISGVATEMDGVALLAGERIVTAGSDGQIRLHQSSDGKLVRELGSASNWVSSLAVTADETTAVFGDHAGQVHTVSLDAAGAITRSWTAAPK